MREIFIKELAVVILTRAHVDSPFDKSDMV